MNGETLERLNRAMMPRSRRVQRLRPSLEKIAPLACGALDWMNLEAKPYPPMKKETRARLAAGYREENERLAKLLDLDFASYWDV